MAQKAQNGTHAQKVQNLPKRPRISNILGYSGPFWAWPRMPKIFKTHFFLGHPVGYDDDDIAVYDDDVAGYDDDSETV